MSHTVKALSTVLLAGMSVTAFNAQAEMIWSDTSVSVLSNQNDYVGDHKDATVVTLEHAAGYSWGDLFAFVDRLEFDNVDGHETYSEVAPRFSLSSLTDSKLSYGIVSDVFISTAWEHDTYRSSTGFSNNFDNYLVGVGANLEVPGFAYFNVNVYQANNEKSDNDQQLTVVWGYPFSVGSADFMFDGYIDWSSAESGSHKSDFHFNPQLRMDVGKYFGMPKKIETGIEYSYWHNKFGFIAETESMFSWMVKVHL